METIVTGEVSYTSDNVEHVTNDPEKARHKGYLPYLKKSSSIRKKPTQRKNISQKKKGLFKYKYMFSNFI